MRTCPNSPMRVLPATVPAAMMNVKFDYVTVDVLAALAPGLARVVPGPLAVAGDKELLREHRVGVVGSRDIDADDEQWIRARVAQIVATGRVVVSGGARGSDRCAREEALRLGGRVVEMLPVAVDERIGQPGVAQAINEGRLVLVSDITPGHRAGGQSGCCTFGRAAMRRNAYIYAGADAVLVARSAHGSGGTWAGATEALRRGLAPVWVREAPRYLGNQALLALGARGLDDQGRATR